MIRRFSINFAVFSMAVDFGLIAFNLWLAGRLRPILDSWVPFVSLVIDVNQPMLLPLGLYFIFPALWVLVMFFFSVYDGRKNFRIVDEWTSITLAAGLAGVSLAGLLYLTYRDTSRLLFITFVTTSYVSLLFWRIPARALYRRRKQRLGWVRRILIVGAGVVGLEIEERLRTYNSQVEVIGFVDDDPKKQAENERVLGSLDDVRALVRRKKISDVIIALPLRAHERMNQIIWDLFDLPVQVFIVPDYFQWTLHHAGMEELANIPMLNVRSPALSEEQRLIKRVFDLIVTFFLMIPALPLMGLIALAIWLDDGAPVLFKQQRVGENGRIFTVLKFRTMVKNAEALQDKVTRVDENGNLIHKRRDDPRVTRVGRVLRRLSLDELPQFFNVLRGDMSLVGPRPELPYLVEKYQPWQRKRFAVPQGITGWWQIHGRSDRPMHLHTEDDLYYIQHYSIWLDIQILIQTFWIVLRGKGAY